MTDWKTKLERRAEAIRRAERARDLDIAAAHTDGMVWRAIGKATGLNHETARKIGERIKREQADKQAPKRPAEPDGP
jgi:hypothetical protein